MPEALGSDAKTIDGRWNNGDEKKRDITVRPSGGTLPQKTLPKEAGHDPPLIAR